MLLRHKRLNATYYPSNCFPFSFNNDKFHQGTYITKDWTYTGAFDESGLFSGKGSLAKCDGSAYEGHFSEGHYDGQGSLDDKPNGTWYMGSFKHGQKHGSGIITYPDGSSYDGDWEEDVKSGIGVESDEKSNRIYRGEFKDGMRHGVGIVNTNNLVLTGHFFQGRTVDGPGWTIMYGKKKNGPNYSGETKQGKPHGNGTLMFTKEDGTIIQYEGSFCNGLFYGTGLLRVSGCDPVTTEWKGAPPDAICEGDSCDNEESCQGRIICAHIGFEYIGNLTGHTMDGEGTLRLLDGSTYEGFFSNGIFNGFGKFTDALSGSVYKGDFKQGLKDGYGEETYLDSHVYCGEFSHGARSGAGQLYRRIGLGPEQPELIYRGEWKDDHMHGKGILFDIVTPSKGTYEGDFVRGKRQGHGSFICESGFVSQGPWDSDNPVVGDCWIITDPVGNVYEGSAFRQGLSGKMMATYTSDILQMAS
jgi:hypothetical protein